MSNDEIETLRDFPAEIRPLDEESRERIYAYATGARKNVMGQRRGLWQMRRTQTRAPRLVAVVAGATLCATLAALGATGAFSNGASQPLRNAPGGGALDAPGNPLSLAFDRTSAGAVRSISVAANPSTQSTTGELEVFYTPSSATPGTGTMVYQQQISLTVPSDAQQSKWSGVLSPSDWKGGCQSGRYSVVLITPTPGTSLADVVSETPSELSNDRNAEVDGAVFTCDGSQANP